MHFLSQYPCDTLPTTSEIHEERKASAKYVDPLNPDPCLNKPTLQVHTRDGEYSVTCNMLKDPTSLRAGENPYMNCNPLKFRIIASEEAQKKMKCRELLSSFGFKPCCCATPKSCTCRSCDEKAVLKKKLHYVSHKVGLGTEMRPEDFTVENMEKSDEFEFTPPAALIGSKPKPIKKETTAAETQYNEKDYVLPPDDLLLKLKNELKAKPKKEVKKPVVKEKGVKAKPK